MNLIDALVGEHGALRELIADAQEIAQHGTDVQVHESLRILGRSLLAHARVEEALLFPLLDGERAEAHSEQAEIRRWLEPDPLVPERTKLATVADLARLHLENEEQVVFPAVQRAVDADQLEASGARWMALRAPQR